MAFFVFVLLGRASTPDVTFYALAVLPPGTNGAAEIVRTSTSQFIENLPKRNVYLNAERQMTKDHTHTVEAGLTLGDTQVLFSAMNSPGKMNVIDPVPVAPEMSATLSGDGFQFPSGSRGRQFVDPVRPTIWSWQVVPTKTGELALLLRVSVVVTVPGLNIEREYAVKEQRVRVVVGLWGWVQRIGRIAWEVMRWVLALLGTLALPHLWKRYVQPSFERVFPGRKWKRRQPR